MINVAITQSLFLLIIYLKNMQTLKVKIKSTKNLYITRNLITKYKPAHAKIIKTQIILCQRP